MLSNPEMPTLHITQKNLDTPCLVIDLDRFMANLTAMRNYAGNAGKKLRPHAKTHKCLTHCESTINLFDKLHVAKDGVIIDCWPVDLRGLSQ